MIHFYTPADCWVRSWLLSHLKEVYVLCKQPQGTRQPKGSAPSCTIYLWFRIALLCLGIS